VGIILNDPEMTPIFDPSAHRSRVAYMFKTLFYPCGLMAFWGFLFPALMLPMVLTFSPYFFVVWTMCFSTDCVLEQLVAFSRSKVEAFCDKLDTSSTTEESAHNQMRDANFWSDMTGQHLVLDKDLENLWRRDHGGMLLLTDVAAKVCWVLVLTVFAVGAQSQDIITLCVGMASGSVAMVLKFLYPIAQVTSLCQSQRANTRCIPRLTVEFVNRGDFAFEAQAAQSRFLQYVLGTPAGIEVPLLGLITERGLVMYAKGAATLAPAALTFLLHRFNHGCVN